jgi:hypothetical protein
MFWYCCDAIVQWYQTPYEVKELWLSKIVNWEENTNYVNLGLRKFPILKDLQIFSSDLRDPCLLRRRSHWYGSCYMIACLTVKLIFRSIGC